MRLRAAAPLLALAAVAATAPLLPQDGSIAGAAGNALVGVIVGVLAPACALSAIMPRRQPALPPLVGGALALTGAMAWLVLMSGILALLEQPMRPATVRTATMGLLAVAAVVAARRAVPEPDDPGASSPHRRTGAAAAVAVAALVLGVPALALRVAPITAASAPYASLAFDGDLARLEGPITLSSRVLDLDILYRSRGNAAVPRRLLVELDGRPIAASALPATSAAGAEGSGPIGRSSPGGRQLDRTSPLQVRRVSIRIAVPDADCLHRVTIRAAGGGAAQPGQLALYASHDGERRPCAGA